MFKVNVNGKEISFTFHHEHFGVPIEIRTNGPLVKAQTTASLDTGRGTVYYDWAYCAVEDNFNKELGRKVALTKVLKYSDLTKDERAAVWNRYHNRWFGDKEYVEVSKWWDSGEHFFDLAERQGLSAWNVSNDPHPELDEIIDNPDVDG